MSVSVVDNYRDRVCNLEKLENLTRLSMSKPKDEEQPLNGGWGKNFGFDFHYPLVSKSPEIKEIFKLIKKVARSNASILIQGETGTGKELIASLIQFISDRSDKQFVKVNCAALPENLLESELFGHEKGAFTGAIQTRIGKFEQADCGTLFLDEIGDMHPTTQAKILRVLQDQEFNRVGGNRNIKVDVRIIAATNKDLFDLIEESSFRADLYYRLNVVTLNIPPLRERKEDILIIAEFFLRKFSQEIRKDVKGFNKETEALIRNHSWPGNIRELQNVIERAVITSRCSTLQFGLPTASESVRPSLLKRKKSVNPGQTEIMTEDEMREVERENIRKALEKANWKVYGDDGAAAMLHIKPTTLVSRMQKMGLEKPG